MKRHFVFLGAVAVVASSGQTMAFHQEDKSNATGTWKWSQILSDGKSVEWALKLKQDGEKLTGKYFACSRETEIKDGSIKEGKISFRTESLINGDDIKVHFSGELDKDSLKGTTEVQRNDGPKKPATGK